MAAAFQREFKRWGKRGGEGKKRGRRKKGEEKKKIGQEEKRVGETPGSLREK